MPHVQRAVAARKLPREIAFLPFIESGFNLKAYSPASAAGLWQFIPGTGRRFGLRSNKWVDERLHLFKSTEAALDYLVTLYDMFGDWGLALAAYNAGEGKISEAVRITQSKDYFELSQRNNMLTGKTQLRRETLDYVPRLLAMAKIYSNLKILGFETIDQSRAVDWAVVEVPPGTNIMSLAPASGLDAEEFRHFNLAFRRQVAPPGESSLVHVPADRVASVQSYLASMPPPTTKVFATAVASDDEPEDRQSTYTVRKGDTLGSIGARTGISVAALMKANKLKRTDLKLGQKLIIPGGKKAAAPKRVVDEDSERKPGKGGVTPVAPLTIARRSSSADADEDATAKTSRVSVNKGDTLLILAKRYNTTVDALLQANGLKSPRELRAGQSLVIPGKGASAARSREKADWSVTGTSEEAQPSSSTSTKKKGEAPVQAGTSSSAIAVATRPASSPPAERKPAGTPGKSSVYTIQSGDTLWAIARKFNVSAADIIAWNKLKKDAVLRPGDTLKLIAR